MPKSFITAHARDVLHPADLPIALARHAAGDWGDIGRADWQENEAVLLHERRLFSVYRDRNNVKFWVITEADRSATTVLLPDDY